MPREAARKVITAAMVQRVKPAPKGKRVEYWDAIVPGFGRRVTDAGGKSFFFRARLGAEHLRMSWPYPVTSLEAARASAKAALEDVARGIDPKAKKAEEERETARRNAVTRWPAWHGRKSILSAPCGRSRKSATRTALPMRCR